ncbi:MAG: zinc-ribbon domain-containing protein [Candidatus Bathyarchaeia archaeon]
MPYCWKCGAELDEDAKFCPTCGTPVGPPVTKPERRRIERKERRPISTLGILAIVLIVLLASAAIIVALAFMPIHAVDVSESRDVPYQAGVDTIKLDFTADVARVNVAFEDLSGKLVTLDVSATGRVGIFGSTDAFDLTSHNTTDNNVLTVTADVDTVGGGWPWYPWLRVTCDIRIDPSMNASIDVETSTGGIVMNTQAGVVLNSLSLEATTGGVKANLVKDVIVAGDVSVKTATGGVEFSWDNVMVTKDILVNARTTTGGVDVDVKQDEELLGNVTLKAKATTGGVNFAIDIHGDIGAKIVSSVTTGGIDIVRQVGFSGTKSPLQSTNYRAGSNFDVSLETTTGGIDIDAKYTP